MFIYLYMQLVQLFMLFIMNTLKISWTLSDDIDKSRRAR